MIDESSEKLIWRGRPSFWNWWAELAIGDLLVLLAGALWWTGCAEYAPWSMAAAVLVYLLVVLVRSGRRYTLTSQRVVEENGLLAKSACEIEVRDIRTLALDQSVLQRIVRTGDLGIASAGSDAIEVHFKGIPDAKSVKERIRRIRLEAQQGAGGKGGE